MKAIQLFLITTISFLVIITSSCDKYERLIDKNERKITIQQGVAGTVVVKSGDLMPFPEKEPEIEVLKNTKLHIYELITLDSSTNIINYTSGLYSLDSLGSKYVKTIESDKNGFYQTYLPVGEYSIIIENNTGHYSKPFLYYCQEDAEGNSVVLPVNISPEAVLVKNIVFNFCVY